MKYIDADKLKAEIERRINSCGQSDWMAKSKEDLNSLLSFIESMEQETSLPSNLDEAAIVAEVEKFLQDPVFGKLLNRNAAIALAKHFHQAGAEWMACREKLPKIHGWLSKDPGDYYVHFSIDKPVFDGTYWQSNDCMLTIPEEVVPWVTPDKLAVVELLIQKK